jgi:DNA modification methylase
VGGELIRAAVLEGDALAELEKLPGGTVDCCVTSPPYWGLRDYGVDGQIGLEASPEEFVARLVAVFREVRRVLKGDGTLWMNLGDSYAARGNGGGGSFMKDRGHTAWANHARLQGFKKAPAGLKSKDMVGVPWMVAFALRSDGWFLRSDIIWHKPNPMPESVSDRPTKSHEYLFLLSKSSRYYYDADAIREPLAEKTLTTYGSRRRSRGTDALGKIASSNWARDVPVRKPRMRPSGPSRAERVELELAGANKRTVWTIATQPNPEAHFATFPEKLVEPCVLAGSRPDGIVLDPFCGTGTTGSVAVGHGRSFIGIELSPQYAGMARRRIERRAPLFTGLIG